MQAGTAGPAHTFAPGVGRPATSSRRPGTTRPGTSFGQQQQQAHGHGVGGGFGMQPGQEGGQLMTYDMMHEEIYEESEDEDVFAFLPPSTADAEAERQQQQEIQRGPGGGGGFAFGIGAVPAGGAGALTGSDQMYYYPQQVGQHNPFAHDPATTTSTTNAAEMNANDLNQYPFGSTVTDYFPSYPYSYAYQPEQAAAGFLGASLAPEASFGRSQDVGGSQLPQYVLQQPPPQSPPSTDSQPSTGYGMAGHDAYKLKRMSSAPRGERDIGVTSVVDEEEEADTRTGSNASPAPSTTGRRGEEVRINLPGVGKKSLEREKDKEKSRDVTDLERGGETDDKDVNSKSGCKTRKRSRKKSGIKSSSNHHATGVEAGTTGQEDGLRKRSRNVNAGPYYAYEKFTRSGRETGRTTASRVMTSPASPTSGTTMINSSIYRQSQLTDSAGYNHNAGGSTTSSYIAQPKRRDDDSMIDSLSFNRRRKHEEEDEEEEIDDEDDDDEATEAESIKMEFDFDAIEEEDSPYPEVRASVSNIDDQDMPALTIRMWFVGLLLCMTSSALNVFFNLRNPAPSVVPLALLLISYPFGKSLAYIMPIRSYRIPIPSLPRAWFPVHQPSFPPFRLFVNLLLPLTLPRSIEFSLNPGPWNIKEHVLVYIMANVAVGSPYAMNAIIVAEQFYGIPLNYWFSLTLILATQLTGFGLAGMTRRFLVWPASMVWPQNLVCCTLLNTLHAEDEDDGIGMYGTLGEKGMSRYRFFIICTTASFLWWFLPGYAFKALSSFSFVCWLAPNNVPVNQLFGIETGLGMSFLTFDWPRISWIGSPLVVPWWAEVNIFVGFVLFYWILVPVLYYSNSWQLAYFPISANGPFDRFGNVYNVSRVLTPDDRFDEAAYFAYSPLYLPATYAMTYLLAFALSTCVIVHTLLYHGYQLYSGFRKIRLEEDDIHAKLMRHYKEVPDWWYAIGFGVCFALAIVAVEVWHTGVPVWSLLLAIALPVVYILPNGFIFAMTGQTITINILAQIIPGTLMPGNPFANMVFKAYSVQTLMAATYFVQDLKLGHYIKVPPRATFFVQMIGTAFAAFVQVGVKHWIFSNIPDVCSPNQKFYLTCPYNQVFFTASAIWGLIGPSRQFGTGSIYHPHLYAIVAGVFLPIPFWIYQRRYPKSWVRYVSLPVILTGVSKIPPSTGINYSSWFLVGIFFQYIIRRRNFAWWGKFNYVLTSALDSGSVIGVIFIFFTLGFPKSRDLKWWGNGVFEDTADYRKTPLLGMPKGGLSWSLLRPTGTLTSVVPTQT